MGCTNKDIEFFYREILSSRVPLVVHQIDEENVLSVSELRHEQCMKTRRREKRKSTQSSPMCTEKRNRNDESDALDVVLTDVFNRENIVVGTESFIHNKNSSIRADEHDLRHFARSVKETINKRREENRVVNFISHEIEIDEMF